MVGRGLQCCKYESVIDRQLLFDAENHRFYRCHDAAGLYSHSNIAVSKAFVFILSLDLTVK